MSNAKLKGQREVEMFIFFAITQNIITFQVVFAVMVFQLYVESNVTFAINGVCVTPLLEHLHCFPLRLYI